MGASAALQCDVRPLASVLSFKNLGQLMTVLDNYWLAEVVDLRKVKRNWDQMSRILGWKRADASGALICIGDVFDEPPDHPKTLMGFHHRAACRLERLKLCHNANFRW